MAYTRHDQWRLCHGSNGTQVQDSEEGDGGSGETSPLGDVKVTDALITWQTLMLRPFQSATGTAKAPIRAFLQDHP